MVTEVGRTDSYAPWAHSDELLFISIHQTFELWFKVMIDEVLRKGDGVVARIDGGNDTFDGV